MARWDEKVILFSLVEKFIIQEMWEEKNLSTSNSEAVIFFVSTQVIQEQKKIKVNRIIKDE